VTILAELGAVAMERAAVQSRHEPFDDDARDQLEVGDLREHLGRTDCGIPNPDPRVPTHGAGTASSRRPTI
jgi:hypothetical protein